MAMNTDPPREDAADAATSPPADAARDAEVLPCGRTLTGLWEAGEAPAGAADAHLDACPHCTAALAELRLLEEVVGAARTREAAERQAPDAAALTARVMDLVRLELRPGRTLPLGDGEEQDLESWIVEAAVARTLRSAAETLEGVRAGSCRVAPADGERGPRARGPLNVRIEVAADWAWPLPELADAVRERLYAAAREEIGIVVGAVDVVIVDLLDGPPDGSAANARPGGEEGGSW